VSARRPRAVGRWLGFACAGVIAGAGAAGAAAPERPTAGHGSSFYLFAGAEALDLRLDPRGSAEFVAAGLDPHVARTSVLVGAGWAFARPLRLDLSVGGWEADIDRPDVDCIVARVVADLHVALAESRAAALEVMVSVGTPVLVYEGLPEEEDLIGVEGGFGLSGRVSVAGPVGLLVGYRWQTARFSRATLELPDGTEIRVHPTAQLETVRVVVTIDL